MSLTPEQEQLLATRYGVKAKSPRVQRAQKIGAAIGVALLIWATWFFSAINFNPVSFKEVGFQVVDEWRTTLEFEVTAPIGTVLSCDLQALDSSFGVVGHRTVELVANESQTTRYSSEIRTTMRAVTAVVEICRAK